MEAKIAHLEMIQAVIARMASNSFVVKGWSMTILSAVLALAVGSSNQTLVGIALLPIVCFWFLDAFFLRQERLYRKLYDEVRVKGPESIDFSMDATQFASCVGSTFRVGWSRTLWPLHTALLVVAVVAWKCV